MRRGRYAGGGARRPRRVERLPVRVELSAAGIGEAVGEAVAVGLGRAGKGARGGGRRRVARSSSATAPELAAGPQEESTPTSLPAQPSLPHAHGS